MATKAEEITTLLQNIQKPIEELNSFLVQDRVSYEMILADLNSLRARVKVETEKYQMIQNQNAVAVKQADEIVMAARNQASGIINAAQKERADGLALLEGVKEFCQGMDRKNWEKLKEKNAKVLATTY